MSRSSKRYCSVLAQHGLVGRNLEQDSFVKLAERSGARRGRLRVGDFSRRLIAVAQVERRKCIEMTAISIAVS